MAILKKLASLKITLVGMGLMVIASLLVYGDPQSVSVWVLVAPMSLLAINLSAAIVTNKRINQQPGLLLFHVSLLTLLILAGIGRLTHLDAHFEIMTGTEFDSQSLQDVLAGPLHRGRLEQVKFIQGPYTVAYAAGLQRGLTHSYVRVFENGAWSDRVVGDDRPLILNDYRMYTTFNKGFSSLMTWIPDGGEPITGSVNMPSYPLFEYKQDNSWTPPGGQPIRFWLRLNTGLKEDQAWILDGRRAEGVLVVNDGSNRHELKPGQQVALPGGQLRYDALTTWMGYRVFYDPTLVWLFVVSVIGVLGLSHYFWTKINLQPWAETDTDTAKEAIESMDDSSVATGKSRVA